ncbi:MAG TPA: hypothetical protein ENN99_12280 [Chloroflexi bacterium]|nr:hypothetical protein [Chloroflexota bacterium]
MDYRRRSNLAGGIVLILLGVAFLAFQLVPGMRYWFSWPWIIISGGVLLLLIGLLTAVPALAIPACIVSGIGGLLYWQNATGNWESWSYAWALIPGFVGVGILLSGLFGGNARQALRDGGGLILTSLVLFVVFASLLGGVNLLGPYWPVLLILLGLWSLVRPLFRAR